MATRIERDSMGEVEVPADALYGAQTQRAVNNFRVSGQPMPIRFIHAIVRIKAAAAMANVALERLDADRGQAIVAAAQEILSGRHDDQFPVDVFQTGSGTSSNMNVNEVIACLASRSGLAVEPNDDVNMGQSSNDVIPSALHLSTVLALHEELVPALDHLHACVTRRAAALDDVVKTGRTHLMDAMPLTMGQELGGWASQIDEARKRLDHAGRGLLGLAQGGTAVGTGVNTRADFGQRVASQLSLDTGLDIRVSDNRFASLASQDPALAFSAQLRGLACVVMKIANDLRWMNSGPLAGLGEIELEALQPGSSIMPGKVNPVIPESAAQVAAQVMGLDSAVAIAAQSGNFQLNVMLPLVANNLLTSVTLLSRTSMLLADDAIATFKVNQGRLAEPLARNPMLVTALNGIIGYQAASVIAKKAYASGQPVLDVAEQETDLERAELERLLDPVRLTHPDDTEDTP